LWLQTKIWQQFFLPLSFAAVFGSGIRDGKNQDPGLTSRIRNTGRILIRIRIWIGINMGSRDPNPDPNKHQNEADPCLKKS
jgi:hypothetical protein